MMELVAAPHVSVTRISGKPSSSLNSSVRSVSLRPHFLGGKLQSQALRLHTDRSRRSRSIQVYASKKTFTSFEDLLQGSDRPVLVDFYATWCGPCQYMVPILEKVQTVMKDEITVVKIDSEKYAELSSKYNIQALPTFILFKDGNPVDRFEGALPENQVIERIRQVLASCKAGV